MPRIGTLIGGQLRELRGQLRYWLGLLLQRLVGRRNLATDLDATQIRSIVIGRINGRLGNTLFLTPMIERLHVLLPQAQIDLALSYPNAVTLLEGMPGVRRVILFPNKGRGIVAGYWRALRRLRATHYDLAIDPTPYSTSGRLLLSLTRARFRLGFSLPSQWAALTHGIALPVQTLHQGRQPAYLVTTALGAAWDPKSIRLWLPLRPDEVAAGRAAVMAAVKTTHATLEPNAALVGYFGHATGLKDLGHIWWMRFWKAFLALRPQAIAVEFLPGPAAAPTVPGFATVHLAAQRQLTAAISNLNLFICADAGPMHLASTTDTPTMGLFQVTDPQMYGPLKSVDRSIDVRQRAPEEVAAIVCAAWSVTVSE